ncbi:GntR family transcriptional regulator [Actinoalloteichus hymeniacidonis]|uniref:Transcriptional regulator n=1 Tax=Actinoalloteichus hymeniacidonis TaxID=340345 RepID=A0AAC9N0W0_9PSEU|nr:GntR family transcriptional regulator [Actinoalloteichus hymeniacidonis]AOS65281.1 transcriptional regulator [Actinoalloteichus hymeniacidonis]MBB5906635.1 DNA-binding GntR family transcriptional regulator [Actinoalloteichus hymeniacidonis]
MTTTGGTGRTDAQTVYTGLRDEILAGVLPPGTPLREVNLATRFSVSRTPVREALRRLEQDRLVISQGRGIQVRAVDPQEVVQVYDMRILLEAEAAGQAAQARTVADLLSLEGLLARDRALVDPDDGTRIRTNLEFHAALWQAAHNPVLSDLLGRLNIHLVHVPRSTLSVGDRWSAALDEHERLIEAIRDRDTALARQIGAAHMSTAREIRMALLRDAAGHR